MEVLKMIGLIVQQLTLQWRKYIVKEMSFAPTLYACQNANPADTHVRTTL